MSAAVAASDMITAARRLTGTETLDEANAFVTNAEALAVLNGELAELYDTILENGFGDYYRAIAQFTTAAGSSLYPLAVDFYAVSSVDIVWSSTVVRTAKLFMEAERNRYRRILPAWSQFCDLWFRPLGSNIELMPIPQSALTVRVNYVPTFTPLQALTDTFDSVNQWHWSAIYGLAAAIRTKDDDEAGASLMLAQKAKVLARVVSMAGRRIDGEPPRVQRSRRYDDEDLF